MTVKYPATCIVHWPSGPVACCERHSEGLVKLANHLGSHVGVQPLFGLEAECTNCVNEAKVKERVLAQVLEKQR